jgi:TetR/AcrR family fatty acid metabolism transcriptional regulator
MKKDSRPAKKDRESAIFEAALKTIKRKGFHKARMSDIAKEAGISYGLVYHYFRNKEDLFDSILHRWWEGLFRLLADVRTGDGQVPDKLKHIIEYFLDTYQRHPELMNIFITEISRSTNNLTGGRLEHFKKFIFTTEEIISAGQKEKILRQDLRPRYLAYIFLGALETFVSAMVLADQRIRGNAQKRRIADSILEVFLNGARTRVGH